MQEKCLSACGVSEKVTVARDAVGNLVRMNCEIHEIVWISVFTF